MAQVNNRITLKKLAAGAGVLIAATFCINLLLNPTPVTQLDAEAMRSLTAEGAFKATRGAGARAIHIFLSTDCSFCRAIEPELDRLENVTVYRHLLPGHGEAGRLKALDVWCSEDQVKAWKAVAAGVTIASKKCDGAVLEKNLGLAKNLGLTMTPSIVYEDGHVTAGMLSSVEIANRVAESTKR
jgi:thiol:disulfide interchange protein DsbC